MRCLTMLLCLSASALAGPHKATPKAAHPPPVDYDAPDMKGWIALYAAQDISCQGSPSQHTNTTINDCIDFVVTDPSLNIGK